MHLQLFFISLILSTIMLEPVLACLAQVPGYQPITLADCYSALETFNWDNNGFLKDRKNENRKTCGDCKIRLTVFTAPTESAFSSLKGVKKDELKKLLDSVGKTCIGPNSGLIRVCDLFL
ncbi:hypothetical protein CROQUDRAFT_456962 [Cronartium quercuum f. sp. fusiforme G11]|uniref:Secreted protein n=1 Tax=Cronartium quercuum f. sp. fusiforme G11 TaxID=708437 RepID=A0A9P6TCV4_9BASI|nr:hypothetical protein CROQUDRAFT_456962 [Cronartium quercuum f. sp. fusiforme G11]